MARMKGPPIRLVKPLDDSNLCRDPKRQKLKKSKQIKPLDLPSNNFIRYLRIVQNSQQSGQLFQRCQGNVGGGRDLTSQT